MVGVIPLCIWRERTQLYSISRVNGVAVRMPSNVFNIDLGEGMYINYAILNTEIVGVVMVRVILPIPRAGAITHTEEQEEEEYVEQSCYCVAALLSMKQNDKQTQTE